MSASTTPMPMKPTCTAATGTASASVARSSLRDPASSMTVVESADMGQETYRRRDAFRTQGRCPVSDS